MKKSKGQTIDSFYINKKETKTKKKNNVGGRSQKKKTKGKIQNGDNKIINLDNEIIIGLTPKREEPVKKQNNKKTKSTKSKSTSKVTKNNKSKNTGAKPKNKKIKKVGETISRPQKGNKNNKVRNEIIKWMLLVLLLGTAIGLFMLSSVFNIKQIIVVNNNKVSSEEIISLSTLNPGVNMFKITNSSIESKLKVNPYIEDVKVKRNFNGTVTLDIKERVPTYMLKFANSYVYINNQGYMLEMSETPLELTMITGFATLPEEIKEGNRLTSEDLKKLEDVIKIIETAKKISMDKIITQIDITDSLNYKLTIESEGKTVQFGDCTNINIKLLKVQAVLEKEKGIEGEIYFQDLERTVFREKV